MYKIRTPAELPAGVDPMREALASLEAARNIREKHLVDNQHRNDLDRILDELSIVRTAVHRDQTSKEARQRWRNAGARTQAVVKVMDLLGKGLHDMAEASGASNSLERLNSVFDIGRNRSKSAFPSNRADRAASDDASMRQARSLDLRKRAKSHGASGKFTYTGGGSEAAAEAADGVEFAPGSEPPKLGDDRRGSTFRLFASKASSGDGTGATKPSFFASQKKKRGGPTAAPPAAEHL
mmetsp:Transcript_31604/g.93061  ORF Transcript_31604/g.93061 Transcript_31604/m.93061 type:complete len:238 (+) Transcript_31604:91-804(+)